MIPTVCKIKPKNIDAIDIFLKILFFVHQLIPRKIKARIYKIKLLEKKIYFIIGYFSAKIE